MTIIGSYGEPRDFAAKKIPTRLPFVRAGAQEGEISATICPPPTGRAADRGV
jgi:hypothetical protein